MRTFADCSRNGNASGMSDPEVCISGRVSAGRIRRLAVEKVKIENECKIGM
jgi:hypothetical protein